MIGFLALAAAAAVFAELVWLWAVLTNAWTRRRERDWWEAD